MNTIKVCCPMCSCDVSCAIELVRVFSTEPEDSHMLVLFRCPVCRYARLKSASIEHLPLLMRSGARVEVTPAEMLDPRRREDAAPVLKPDDVLDFALALRQWDGCVGSDHGVG